MIIKLDKNEMSNKKVNTIFKKELDEFQILKKEFINKVNTLSSFKHVVDHIDYFISVEVLEEHVLKPMGIIEYTEQEDLENNISYAEIKDIITKNIEKNIF